MKHSKISHQSRPLFANPDTCIELVAALRWPHGVAYSPTARRCKLLGETKTLAV